jgi:hypothetical protein
MLNAIMYMTEPTGGGVVFEDKIEGRMAAASVTLRKTQGKRSTVAGANQRLNPLRWSLNPGVTVAGEVLIRGPEVCGKR